MARIDELITEIYDSEAIELTGYLNEEQQRRIEDKVLLAIMSEEFGEESENRGYVSEDASVKASNIDALVSRRKKINKRKLLVFGLAAVLLMGLCITAFGKTYPDWDIELLRIMGLSKADTLQLESGEVKINESAICKAIETIDGKTSEKKVVVTAVNSIGDKNSAYIRIDTDYKVPESFDETRDYILPEDANIKVYKKDPEKHSLETAMGSVFSSEIRDGYLSFMVEISGCPELNKSYVKIDMKDMYLCKDGLLENAEHEEELLLKGEWNLQWKYEYKSNARSYSMLQPVVIENQKYYVTKVEISPISVQIYGFRMPWDREKDYKIFEVEKICYEDGTELVVEESTVGGARNRMWFDSFTGVKELGKVIDVKNVESVIVNGNRIKLK